MDLHNIGSAEGEAMSREEKQNKNPFELVKVVKVIDGDTFIASDGRRVRLIGVDAPESYSGLKSTEIKRRSIQLANY